MRSSVEARVRGRYDSRNGRARRVSSCWWQHGQHGCGSSNHRQDPDLPAQDRLGGDPPAGVAASAGHGVLASASSTTSSRSHGLGRTRHLHAFEIGAATLRRRPDPDWDEDEASGRGRRKVEPVRGLKKFLYLRFRRQLGSTHPVEKDLTLNRRRLPAGCTAGERACPPEDCGGPWGYGDFLEAVQNRTPSTRTCWSGGGGFDPSVRHRVHGRSSGCIRLGRNPAALRPLTNESLTESPTGDVRTANPIGKPTELIAAETMTLDRGRCGEAVAAQRSRATTLSGHGGEFGLSEFRPSVRSSNDSSRGADDTPPTRWPRRLWAAPDDGQASRSRQISRVK